MSAEKVARDQEVGAFGDVELVGERHGDRSDQSAILAYLVRIPGR